MGYVRGHPSDFDRWAKSGLSDWSYANALPYFRKQERWEHGADLYRGDSGPLVVQESRYQDSLVDAYIEAGLALGHPPMPTTTALNRKVLGAFSRPLARGGGAALLLRIFTPCCSAPI